MTIEPDSYVVLRYPVDKIPSPATSEWVIDVYRDFGNVEIYHIHTSGAISEIEGTARDYYWGEPEDSTGEKMQCEECKKSIPARIRRVATDISDLILARTEK